MTIRAILRNGQIQPIDRLPPEWREGQELLIEDTSRPASDGQFDTPSGAEIDEWARELEAAVERIPPEERERFTRALEEVERESKEAVRRAWGLA